MRNSRGPEDRPSRARPGHHDPNHGVGGAPPARSALTLRLVLATVGLLACGIWAVLNHRGDGPLWLTVLLTVLSLVAVVDIAVVTRRKARGEPG
jgi:hypothetical protein